MAAMLRQVLLALLLAFVAVAAVPNKIDQIIGGLEEADVASGEQLAEGDGRDAEYALSDVMFADGNDQTERDDQEDMDIEMNHVDDYIMKTNYLNLSHTGTPSTVLTELENNPHPTDSSPATMRGDAGMCVPACYRHGKLSHKPKVKCDRFICKACAQCFGKPSGSALCHNSYTSMITRVKYGHAEIPGCAGKATSKSPDACKLPMGREAFNVCDLLGEACAGVMVSPDFPTVVLKAPFPSAEDVKTGPSKWMMCVK